MMRVSIYPSLALLTLLSGCGGSCPNPGSSDSPSTTTFFAQTGENSFSQVRSDGTILNSFSLPVGFVLPRFNSNSSQFIAETSDGKGLSLFNSNGQKIRDLQVPSGPGFIEAVYGSSFNSVTVRWSGSTYVIPVSGSTPIQVDTDTDDIDSSLQKISQVTGEQVIISNPDGTSPISVNRPEGSETFTWSPDGSRLAARVTPRAFFVVNRDGSSPRTIPTTGTPLFSLWTPDSQSMIYFQSSSEPFEWGTSTGNWRIINLTTGVDRVYYSRSTLIFSSVVAPSNQPLE